MKDLKKGNSGFVRPTETQRKVLANVKFENAMGRPKKEDNEKLQVESIRFSNDEKDQLKKAAKKKGFLNWKKYLKYVALEDAKKSA